MKQCIILERTEIDRMLKGESFTLHFANGMEVAISVAQELCEESELSEQRERVTQPEIEKPRKAVPKKRKWGKGRVFRRGATWWVGYHKNGREIRESSRSDQRQEAEQFLAERMAKVTAAPVVQSPNRHFWCEPCGESFKTAQQLGAHNRYRHPKPPIEQNPARRTRGWKPQEPSSKEYRCNPCDLTFSNRFALEDHQEEKHGVKIVA